MSRFSGDYVENDGLRKSTQNADYSDVIALIQDHHAACKNIAAPTEPDEPASKSLDPLNARRVVFNTATVEGRKDAGQKLPNLSHCSFLRTMTGRPKPVPIPPPRLWRFRVAGYFETGL